MGKEMLVVGSGLIGQTVTSEAQKQGMEVSMTAKSEKEDPSGNLELLDFTNREEVFKYFRDHLGIQRVIVAAGLALPSAANNNPELAMLLNAEGPKNIGDAILALPEVYRPKVLFMGSALQYDVQRSGAVKETTPLLSTGGGYVESKMALVDVVQGLVRKGLDAKIAMIFNSTGPTQSVDYFFPAMADQVAKISLGLQDKVVTSRYVDHAMDFSHVEDTARGLIYAVEGKSGELINIASGYGVRLRDVINTLINISGIEGVTHAVDPKYVTSAPKINAIWGDTTKLRNMGFIPEKNLQDICIDLLEARLQANQEK